LIILCQGIILEIGPSLKSYWKNASPLFIGCCSSFSSTGLNAGIGYNNSSTTSCCNSSSSIGLDVETDCNYSSTTC